MRNNSVLLVVDMQKGFLSEHSSHILPNVIRLVDECSIRQIPLVCSKFVNTPDSQFVKLLDWHELSSAPEIDISDELNLFERTEITKNFYTSITATMKELIRVNNWQTILVCGVSTESCVLKTAVDAFELGLRPVIVSDACASDLSDEAHRAGLHVLEIMIGSKQIVTMKELWNLMSL
jgi:nicotinamidase-related amidase